MTYTITLRDLRDALYPSEFLDGRPRQQYSVKRIWPRIHNAIRIINHDARIPLLGPKTGITRIASLILFVKSSRSY